MAFALSARSRARLAGVHPELKAVVERAIQITTVDFGVIEGVRSEARQRALYAQGRTKPGKIVTWTLRSNHFIQPSTGYGHAVDLVPYVDNDIEWDDNGKLGLWPRVAEAMKSAAQELGVAIQWGGDWKRVDRPHFELVRP